MTDYKSSGVDLKLGGEASKILYNAAKLTWKNRKGKLGEVAEVFSDFSGLRAINVGGLPQDTYMSMNLDGVGTKIELGERMWKHDTVAFDLFAMVCDDAVVRGAEPVILGSILDVRSLENNIEYVKQLATGYVLAAQDANVAVVNGEIAELGARVSGYGNFNYNWGASVIWFAQKNKLLSGYEIKEGDSLVGLQENGFRSNGFSLARKILEDTHGKEWHTEKYKGKKIGELALYPSKIYTRAVADMFGGFDREPQAEIHGAAHITGGGIPEKLGRILKPANLGAYLDDLFAPCELMQYCQEKGKVTDAEAYTAWNMGQGMIIASPQALDVMSVAYNYGIESKVIGVITKEPGIRILSKGLDSGREIRFG